MLLLFASVLFSRSVWAFSDKSTGSGDTCLWVSLLLGVAVATICLYKLDRVALEKRMMSIRHDSGVRNGRLFSGTEIDTLEDLIFETT
jgi:hypothetical protein